MMKYIVLIMVFAQLSQAHRSFYAGRQPYYKRVSETTTTTDSIVNKVGGDTESEVAESSSPTPTLSEYDAFIQRVSSWPEDKQPFWFKNRHAISAMINRNVDGGCVQQLPKKNTALRSDFAPFRR